MEDDYYAKVKDPIAFDILSGNYWEHQKVEKEIARFTHPMNKKRVKIRQSSEELRMKLKSLLE